MGGWDACLKLPDLRSVNTSGLRSISPSCFDPESFEKIVHIDPALKGPALKAPASGAMEDAADSTSCHDSWGVCFSGCSPLTITCMAVNRKWVDDAEFWLVSVCPDLRLHLSGDCTHTCRQNLLCVGKEKASSNRQCEQIQGLWQRFVCHARCECMQPWLRGWGPIVSHCSPLKREV